LDEPLATDLANVGLLIGVRSPMGYHRGLLGESFVAYVADVWFFARVRSHVPFELVMLVECLTASFTNMWLDTMNGSKVMDVMDVIPESFGTITNITDERMLLIV